MHSNFHTRINKPAYLLLAIIVLFLVFYISSVQKLIYFWISNEYTYSHGKLLFFVCGYYFYKSWKINKNDLVFSFSLSGLLLLLVFSFAWLASKIIFVNTIELISVPFLLMFLFVSLLGWRQSKQFSFPILLMLLALPLFEWLVPILQVVTAAMVGVMLEITGITSVVEGVLILIPAGTFEVDSGCSGLNVFLVGLILSSLYAHINNFKLKEGAVLLVLGMAMTILSNVMRVYIIVIVGNETQMQHPLINEHANLGWFVFLITMGIFFFLVNRFWPALDVSETHDSHNEYVSEKNGGSEWRVQRAVPGIVLTIIGAGLGPLFMFAHQQQDVSDVTGSYKIPERINSWKVNNNIHQQWKIRFRGGEGDFAVNQLFVNDTNENVFLNLRHFSKQNVGNEAINNSNSVYDRSAWVRVWVRAYTSYTNDNLPNDIEETLVRNKKNQEVLVWRWYSTLGKKTGNPYKAKIYNLFAVLTGKPEIAVFVISTKVALSYDYSRKILEDFGVAISHIAHIN